MARLVALALALAACHPPRPALSGTREHVAAERTVVLASGTRVLAPQGWWLGVGRDVVVLEDPERELHLYLLEVAERDPAAAIQAAWKRVQPGFARKVEQTLRPPPRDGWDSVAIVVYQTGVAEQRTVWGRARSKGDMSYVALLDGKDAAVSRRGAQISITGLSFKPASVVEETFRGKPAHAFEGARVQALEAFLGEAQRALKVPGVALAVVQGGRVVYERGFGVREVGKEGPVTPATLFLIGSVTKSLTTLLMAALVDAGKLAWERPVREILPSFALGDAEVTKRLELRHAVCACTGMPRQDLEMLFEYAGVTPEQRVASLASMKPTTGFGETFQYSNLLVTAGGYAAARAAVPEGPLGAAYDAAMQRYVFGPLGMTSTTFDFAVAERAERAMPHAEDHRGVVQVLPMGDELALPPVRPAGGAWSNVRDMARWVLLELGKDGAISQKNLRRRREPMARISEKMHYGLGLMVNKENGLESVGHGGNTLGFSADLFFLPEQGVGAVLLANARGANAFLAVVKRRLRELLFDGREEAKGMLAFTERAKEEARSREEKKTRVPPDAGWIRGLLGVWSNPGLGKVELRAEGSGYVLDAGEWRSAVGEKREADGTRLVTLVGPTMTGLPFVPVEKDGKVRLLLDAGQQQYWFERVR